jgi:hypothetical protein
MKINTPFATRMEILTNIYQFYADIDDLGMVDYCADVAHIFYLAENITLGYATPTPDGLEMLDKVWLDVLRMFGEQEDKGFANYFELTDNK